MLAERAPHLISRISENLEFLNGRAVSIDIDGVTQASFILALKNASQQVKKVVLKEKVTSYWELAKIGKESGMLQDEALSFAKGVYNRHEVYANAPPMSGIRTLLKIFNEISIPYLFVSSRPIDFYSTTREWFRQTFLWDDREKIILGRREGMSSGEFKSRVITDCNVGLHIEDAPDEASAIVQNTAAYVLVVPQPWNIHDELSHPKIKTFDNYSSLAGSWPILRFLVSSEAKQFFANVAQY